MMKESDDDAAVPAAILGGDAGLLRFAAGDCCKVALPKFGTLGQALDLPEVNRRQATECQAPLGALLLGRHCDWLKRGQRT